MKPMKLSIGNQTAFAAESVFVPFEFALEQGFDAFEFFPDRGPDGTGGWDERAMSLDAREYIRRAADACQLMLTTHAPLEYQPLQSAQDARLDSILEFAQDIGAGLLNLHLDMTEGVEAFGRALAPALEATGRSGLKLSLENTVWTGPEAFNAFFGWLHREHGDDAAHVGLCFDMGHANVCTATRNDYCGFLDRLDPDIPIAHLHLHENFGDWDAHLPLFTGPSRDDPGGLLGLLERLAARGFAGAGILEQWPEPPTMLVEARDRLRLLLNAADGT